MVRTWTTSDRSHCPIDSTDTVVPTAWLRVLPEVADTLQALTWTRLSALNFYLTPS